MSNSFLELPSNTPQNVQSANNTFIGLDVFSKPLTEKQILSNPYQTIPLNKVEGVGRYLNSSTYNKLGFSFNPELENKYYQETPWYNQLGNATAQFFGQAGAAFEAQMSKLEQIKQTFGTTNDDYLKDAFQASEDLREKYPTFKSANETYGILGYVPFTGGAFSKWSNFVPNLGFTAGTIAGVFAENAVATAIIEGTTGGTATPLLAGKWLKGLYDGVRAIKSFSDIKKLASLANIGKNLYETEKVLGSAGNIVRGYEAFKAGKSLNGALHSVYGGYQLYSTAAGEALIENANSVGEIMKDFKNDFIEKNGREPNGTELAKMQESAEGLILPSSLGNIGILMASNGLQELNAFKVGKSLSAFALTGSKKLGEAVGKKVVFDKATGLYREQLAKEITKANLKSIGRGAFNILSEGLEESAQGVVAEATKNYVKAKYYDKPISWTDALGQGFAYAASDQGMEEFYAGIVTGGLFSGGGKALNQYQLKRDEKANFMATGKSITDIAKEEIKTLNEDVISLLKYNLATSASSENIKVQTVIQKQIMDAYAEGNLKKANFFKSQAAYKAMFTAKAYGKDEELIKHYKELKNLEKSDLAKYLNIEESELADPEEMDKTIQHLQDSSDFIDYVAKKYTNPTRKPSVSDPKYAKMTSEEMKEAYLQDSTRFEAWQGAQELLAGQYFFAKSFNKEYQKLKTNLEGTNVPMDLLAAVMSQSDDASTSYTKLMDVQKRADEISSLMEYYVKKNDLKEVKNLSKSLEELIEEAKPLKESIENFKSPNENAQINYLKELVKKRDNVLLSLQLLDKNENKNQAEIQKYNEQLENIEKEYNIIASTVISREDKIKAVNELRPEDRKLKFNLDNLLSSEDSISSVEDLVKAYNLLGEMKKNIDYSENVIDTLNSPEKMSEHAAYMLSRIYEARKNLFSNIVSGEYTDFEDIKVEDVKVEEVKEEEKPEEKPKPAKKVNSKFKKGNKVLYNKKEYTIEEIELEEGEVKVTLIDSNKDTINITGTKKLSPVKEKEEVVVEEVDVLEPKPIEDKEVVLELNPIVLDIEESDGKTDEAIKVEKLRAEEQAEYAGMADPTDKVERKKIYDKYDELITPLLIEDIEKRRQEDLINLLPKVKESDSNLDFSAAFNIGIPEFYQQMFDMVKEGKDTIAGVKEKNAPLLQKLYNEGKLKDKKDVWLALNPEANKINAEYDAKLEKLKPKEEIETDKEEELTVEEKINKEILSKSSEVLDQEAFTGARELTEEEKEIERQIVKAAIEKFKDSSNSGPVDKLIENYKFIKQFIKESNDIMKDMDSVFEIIEKKDYEDWKKSLDPTDLNDEIKSLSDPWLGEANENTIIKYLLNRYIDTQLGMMGQSSLSDAEEEEAIKAEPGNSGNITAEDAIDSATPITVEDLEEPIISREEYLNEIVNKIVDSLNETGKITLNKEDKKFYDENQSEIDGIVNKLINKKESVLEDEQESFLEAFNKLLLIGDKEIENKSDAIYKILDKIKFSISDSWFKFKEKDISINLQQVLKELSSEYKNVKYTNIEKSYIDKDDKQRVELYTHRIINKDAEKDYQDFKLFNHQYSLHLDLTNENTKLIVDKLLDFANNNDVYILIGSAYNIARPDNIRIYSKGKMKLATEKLDNLLKDLTSITSSEMSNPVLNDIVYERFPTTQKLAAFLNSLPTDKNDKENSIKEIILNYLNINKEDRKFLRSPDDYDYKNGLSLNSLEAAQLFAKAYNKFLLSGKINRQYIIEPIVRQQINKAVFYGEVNALYNELLNNPVFKSIKTTQYFSDLLGAARDKMEKLKVFNFSNTTLSIGDTLYDSDNNEYTILDHTIFGKTTKVKDLVKEIRQIKVLKVQDKKTKQEKVVNQYEFKNSYSPYPFKDSGTLESVLKEEKKEEMDAMTVNLLPDTLFTTISNDNDIFSVFVNGKKEMREDVDQNAAIGRLVIQRLSDQTDVKVKVETPEYDNPDSPFYIEEGKSNPNVPQRVQDAILERRKEDPENKNYGKIVTVVNSRGQYVTYDPNGYPTKNNGIIPLFFLPKGELIISGENVSYGGRKLRPLSEIVDIKNKSEKEIEELKNQLLKRIRQEAEELDKLHNLEKYTYLDVDFISGGIVDKDDYLNYSDVEKFDKQSKLSFTMSRVKGQKGIITMDLNNTHIELKQKGMGEEMALSILAYLGVEDDYFARKGFSIGKELKAKYRELNNKIKKFQKEGDKISSYEARIQYRNFLERVLFMGTKNFEVLFDTYFMHDSNPEVFDGIAIRDYNTDKTEEKGIPNLFPIGNVWKRLNNNKNNDDYYSYLDTIVSLLSKVVFDTTPDFVESQLNTNFVSKDGVLDIGTVDVKKYLMEKYVVKGLIVNESFLSSKNRYIKLTMPVSKTTKSPSKTEDELSFEQMITTMEEAERNSEKLLNLAPLSKNRKSNPTKKDLPADQAYKNSVMNEIRNVLGDADIRLKKVDSDKMKKDMENATSMSEVDKIKKDILTKNKC